MQQLRSAAPAPRDARGRAAAFALTVAVYFSLALLATQTLGLLHYIVHGSGPVQAHTATNVHGAAPDGHQVAGGLHAKADVDDHGFLAHLFSGHGGDADCRAYDQSSHVDAVPDFSAPVLPLVVAPFLLCILPGLATARWHALFQARGPPSLR